MGTLSVDVALRADPLSITMALVVTGVGSLIHLYAVGPMGDPRFGTFFAYLNLFVFFMLMLVLADNYLLLYLGWEGVGLCSYLIGFWYERPLASSAAKKAFVTTRIGDAAMLLGIVLIWLHLGRSTSGRVRRARERAGQGAATAISLLLLAGAIGKSAQLLARMAPGCDGGTHAGLGADPRRDDGDGRCGLVEYVRVLFELSGTALTVVLVVGLVSALYAALASIGQFDLKRALAYSTMSQIGVHVLRGRDALLHRSDAPARVPRLLQGTALPHRGKRPAGLHDETDMRRMGGLREQMPVSATWFAIGALPRRHPAARRVLREGPDRGVRCDQPPGAGVGAGVDRDFPLRALHRAAAVLTFFSRRRGERARGAGPDAGPARGPRVADRGGRARAGAHRRGRPARRLPGTVVGPIEHGEAALSEAELVAISVVLAVAAVAVAFWIWASGRVDWEAFPERQPELAGWLANAFYVNALYGWRWSSIPARGSVRRSRWSISG